MKRQSFLFLFFLIQIGVGIFNSSKTYSQDSNDSLHYYHDIIIKPKNSQKINSAFIFFEKEIERQLEKKDTISAVHNLRRVTIGQFQLGLLYESENTAVRAIQLLENQDENEASIESMRGLTNHLGLVYRKLGLPEKSLEYYSEALGLATGTVDSLVIINNISNIYIDQKNYVLAIKNSSLAYEKSKNQKDILRTALALSNLGFAQSKINNPDALKNLSTALNIRQRENDIPGIYSSYDHLSNYYSDRNNNEKAIDYANKAYELAKLLNSPSYIEDALSLLLNLSENPQVLEYKNLKDSMALAKQNQENKYASIKYDVEKERRKTLAAELQGEQQKRYTIISLFILLLLIIAFSFIVYQKNQQKKNATLHAAYQAEIRMGKKVHDEVGNDIFYLMTQIQNNPELLLKNNGFVLLEGLDNIYQKARDITKEHTPIKTDDSFGEELMALLNSYGNDHIKVITKELESGFWGVLNQNQKLELFWVVRELMTNMRKYSNASFVGITFTKTGEHLEFNYGDNGVGFINEHKNWGNGLKSVENRIKNLNGTFSFDSEPKKGVTLKIRFPL